MALPWHCRGIPMELPWKCHGNAMAYNGLTVWKPGFSMDLPKCVENVSEMCSLVVREVVHWIRTAILCRMPVVSRPGLARRPRWWPGFPHGIYPMGYNPMGIYSMGYIPWDISHGTYPMGIYPHGDISHGIYPMGYIPWDISHGDISSWGYIPWDISHGIYPMGYIPWNVSHEIYPMGCIPWDTTHFRTHFLHILLRL